MKKITNKKMIVSGDFVEIFEFEEGVIYGKDDRPRKSTYVGIRKENTLENRQRSLGTAKGNLKRLINANAGKWEDKYGQWFMPVFLTLTFAENITNIKRANRIFSKFKQRLDYEIMGKKKSYLKYVGIIEFQKRGAIHYHVLIFNLPYLENIYDKIREIWGEGHIIVKSIKDIKTVASYVCKYMTKGKADERLCGQKSYFSSNGLKKPIEILNDSQITEILNSDLENVEFREDKFVSEFCGETRYRVYNLQDMKAAGKNPKEFLDKINPNLIAIKFNDTV
ncbi:MAG: hypothetical protein WCQ96_01510 [Patescibacteria group bacterium]